MASFCVPRMIEDAEVTPQFRPSPSASDGSPMTVRGGGVPLSRHGFNAALENGSAASELRRRCA